MIGHLDNFLGVKAVMDLFFSGVIDNHYTRIELTYGEEEDFSGAKEIDKKHNPYVYRIVENLAITSGLPMPRVYVIDDSAMNAFAGPTQKIVDIFKNKGFVPMWDDVVHVKETCSVEGCREYGSPRAKLNGRIHRMWIRVEDLACVCYKHAQEENNEAEEGAACVPLFHALMTRWKETSIGKRVEERLEQLGRLTCPLSGQEFTAPEGAVMNFTALLLVVSDTTKALEARKWAMGTLLKVYATLYVAETKEALQVQWDEEGEPVVVRRQKGARTQATRDDDLVVSIIQRVMKMEVDETMSTKDIVRATGFYHNPGRPAPFVHKEVIAKTLATAFGKVTKETRNGREKNVRVFFGTREVLARFYEAEASESKYLHGDVSALKCLKGGKTPFEGFDLSLGSGLPSSQEKFGASLAEHIVSKPNGRQKKPTNKGHKGKNRHRDEQWR